MEKSRQARRVATGNRSGHTVSTWWGVFAAQKVEKVAKIFPCRVSTKYARPTLFTWLIRKRKKMVEIEVRKKRGIFSMGKGNHVTS